VNRSSGDGLLRKIMFVSVFLVLMSAGGVGAVTNVTGCGTLNTAGETYVLQNDISTTGTCFTIITSSWMGQVTVLPAAGVMELTVFLSLRKAASQLKTSLSTVLETESTSNLLPAAP